LSATTRYCVILPLYRILAIELLTVSQALDMRKPLRSSPAIEQFIDTFRQEVSFIEYDRVLHHDIEQATRFLENYEFS